MEVYFTIIVFIFGTLLGSFYNVVGYRLPKGLSLIKPGSFCPKCKHSLKWYELIPVLSFMIQRGKCRECKDKTVFGKPAHMGINMAHITVLVYNHSGAFRIPSATDPVQVYGMDRSVLIGTNSITYSFTVSA